MKGRNDVLRTNQPTTNGPMMQHSQTSLEVTKATIETTNTHPPVAELTPELRRILSTVEVGDRLSVGYKSLSTLPSDLHGKVTDVDRESGDVRLSTNHGDAYLHINPGNGTYYFDDHFDRTPADGFTITSVTLRAVRDQ